MSQVSAWKRLVWVSLFAVSFAFVESSVVVYLRALYYPEGFSFPLKMMSQHHLVVELAREAATIVMLAAVGVISGSKRWERFGYFLVGFGVWDIFYYVWLRLILDWPTSLLDWDILFLIPLPWIGPVIAPVLISIQMILFGSLIGLRFESRKFFHPNRWSWILAITGTTSLLYSFMLDTSATLRGQIPVPYFYTLLAAALVAYLIAFVLACNPLASSRPQSHA